MWIRRSSMSSSGETAISVCVSNSWSRRRNSARASEKIASYSPALERRLVGGRPELPARHVAEVAERAPVVAGGVFTPARDRDVLPAAVAAARIRDHHVVSAVRQQLHFRYGVSGVLKTRTGVSGRRRSSWMLGELGGVRVEGRGLGNPLLEQQRGRLEQRIRLESLLHRTVQEQIGQGEEAHALVMGHERPDDGARLPAGQTGRGVVDGFIEAVSPSNPSAASRCRFRHASSGATISASAEA